MRESNFAFPAQNRACVCISSQLYDRRALDTNSSLPLFNSLTHLAYLTSTSPRIREIMTMDGGLERLVRILHDFCTSPPPPENPTLFYGLSPPSSYPPKLPPVLNPKQFDKQAQYRFSLAFQCVVNIGVRGSEAIRGRVVQAGTLDVVGCILEAWLVGKGFAVGPSVSASGMPRESREQRLARRQAHLEARQREQAREQARELARALERERLIQRISTESRTQEDEAMDVEPPAEASRAPDADTPTDTSSNETPGGTNTPQGTVVVPGRDRSGTIIARPAWDPVTAANHHHRRSHRSRPSVGAASGGASTSTSADNSRPETETEDDGDVDMDRESSRDGDASGTPSPERRGSTTGTIRAPTVHARRAVGIVSDTVPNTTGPSINSDAHIIITQQGENVEGVGVEDGLVSLETNDDFAMGAPPGAPGAIEPARLPEPHGTGERTPRAGTTNLPRVIPINVPPVPNTAIRVTAGADAGGVRAGRTHTSRGTNTPAIGVNVTGPHGPVGSGPHHHHHHRDSEGPYTESDVLLSLQLLAYLSKYPHVRQAFYKPRTSFHPATAQLPAGDGRFAQPIAGPSMYRAAPVSTVTVQGPASLAKDKEPNTFMKVINTATGRGKEKEKASTAGAESSASGAAAVPVAPQRMTNVFSLVERFTFRHSTAELESSNPPPSLPPEIQYWAGVIMRNACRKDETRGGIRQCANMLCGRWESFPREFAKCRRCRKAKYCGKECQSTAWSEGHRFWCNAKDPEEDGEHHHGHHGEGSSRNAAAAPTGAANGTNNAQARAERRAERERDRTVRMNAEQTAVRSAISVLAREDTLAVLNAPPSPTAAGAAQEEGLAGRAAGEAGEDDMVVG
ncbi:hypothetical protein WOLCODRAFT_132497 [Wolfiporia cocos MD-104 SS10]|uniref:MYND-type domain-containing protein n=1 Tax=Wolfiporia cocos (strain MD-104) TaxID=742152 RepID=A0A2H3JKI5_WOLCO|nr:hypothetical protein WOLCODRAFT_132497 [Wolfiporia cocos MD-104 SS10]